MAVKVSLCVVTRNQEDSLGEFLESSKELADEIIFVDTGSRDKTPEIARNFGCKVFNFQQKEGDWIEEARNFSLAQAEGDWIIVLDSDEKISKKDFKKLRELAETDEYVGYYLIQRQYTNQTGAAGWVSSKGDSYEESRVAAGWYENPILRLFKNDKRVKYKGKPHDLVDESVKSIGKICMTDLPMHHFGELKRDKTGKADRNLNFLQQELKEQIEKKDFDKLFYTYYQIACEYVGKNQLEEAEENLKKSIEHNPDYAPSLRNLAGIYIKEKKLEEAEKILIKSLNIEPNADAENNLGIIFSERKELNRAVKKFEKALEMNEKSADYNFNLGIVYLKMGKENKARAYFEKAIELNPEYSKRIKFG